MTASASYVTGSNPDAPFSLKIHRGESMVLLAMNWLNGKPPESFVGFAIEYKEPDGDRFYVLKNRLSFDADTDRKTLATSLAPIQKFRWVHFPRHAELAGTFVYRVRPVYMNELDELSYGEVQEAGIALGLETFPDELNIAFTRGFVSSQAFTDRFLAGHDVKELLPASADQGLQFEASHPDAKRALEWMGFEARNAIMQVLDEALSDPAARVRVIAYDLNEPEVVQRLAALKDRLRIIIDNSAEHRAESSAESQAERILRESAGVDHVLRQHLGSLQHNKTIVVDSPALKLVVCGSTNFSWRGFYIQANNAVVLRSARAVAVFQRAFDTYWDAGESSVSGFSGSDSTSWTDLQLQAVDAKVTFSPHDPANAVLDMVAADVRDQTTSSILFALAFLYKTTGAMHDAITALTDRKDVFVYGMSDQDTGIDLRTASGHMAVVEPATLTAGVPAPFQKEVAGGGGIRLHHKFIVTDFDKPHAKVYLGSFNFSKPADLSNGEQLLVIANQRVATAYMVEALRLFDHYEFRVKHEKAKELHKPLRLAKPPRAAGEKPWWEDDWTVPLKIKDRQLFS